MGFLPWRVELAVRDAKRLVPAVTPAILVVMLMWVTFEVRVKDRSTMGGVLPIFDAIFDAILMEMGERRGSREYKDGRDLKTAHHDSIEGATHGRHCARRRG